MQIAKMNAMLTATAKGFSGVFGDAKKSVNSFGSSFVSVAKTVAGYGSAIAGGAAVYQITNLTKASIDNIDALKDQAEAIGVSTEALSKLQYAASFAGIDATTMGAAVGKMTKNLAEAATNGGETSDALKSIGLDARTLTALAPDEAFAKIAGALAKLESPYQRSIAANAIFGKQWQALIPVLNQGEEGLKRAGLEAARFGVAISTTDAEAVERAADSFTRVQAVITGAANALAIQLAPFLEAAAMKMVEFGTAGGGAGAIITNAVEFVAKAIATASDYVELLKAGFYLLEAGVIGAVGGIIKMIDYAGQAFVDLANLAPGVELTWTTAFSSMADSMAADVIAATDKAGAAFDTFSNGSNAKAVTKYFDDIKQKAKEAADAADLLNGSKPKFDPLENGTPQAAGGGILSSIGGLLKNSFTDAAKAAADIPKQAAFTDPGGPQLLQSGSQEAASFVARMQREQAAKENDPAVKTQKKTEVNTARTATAMEKLAASIAVLT